MKIALLSFAGLLLAAVSAGADVKKTVIKLPLPALTSDDSAGGIVVAELNGDGKPDFLVTRRGHLAALDNSGVVLWKKKVAVAVTSQSENNGLPGHNGPGVGAGDLDGDERTEVIFPLLDGTIVVVDGETGRVEASVKPAVPEGAERWELAMVTDFRGEGDRDVLLQATNKKGYRTGRYLRAYSYEALRKERVPLWERDDYVGCAHNGARVADLDGDGRDEVLGEMILSHEGKFLARAAKYKGHMDSVFVADVDPGEDGLEIVLLEEGSNYLQIVGMEGPIWRKEFRRQEPQNAAVGRFKQGSDEIFIWCRSRYNEHQKPFVFNSKGEKVFDYAMDDLAPKGWTASGVEVIHTIDWTGEEAQMACGKERHKSGDVCVFEPLTGKFVLRLTEKAERLYVADVFGDWREEIVVWNGAELHVYENAAKNPRPGEKRKWAERNYRRLKQCHNYYSP